MSWLLIPTKPLLVLPELAIRIGLDEAIALQQVHYRLANQQEAAICDPEMQSRYFRDSRWWVSLTEQEWQKQFPFWSLPTISRVFETLEEMQLLLLARFSAGKQNRRKWHSIDYEALKLIEDIDSANDTPNLSRKARTEEVAKVIRSKRSDQNEFISNRSDQNDRIKIESDESKKSDPIKLIGSSLYRDIYLNQDLNNTFLESETFFSTNGTADADAIRQRVSSSGDAGAIGSSEPNQVAEGSTHTNPGPEVAHVEPKGSGEDQVSPEKSQGKKKKKPAANEPKYLSCFKGDKDMKADFQALYKAHPKHTYPKEAAEEYRRQREAGVSAEEIFRDHQEALQTVWSKQPDRYAPKLHKWLEERAARRESGLDLIDKPSLLHPQQYREIRDQYFQVCAELDVPFGDEQEAQAVWNAQVRDEEKLACIVEATPYYLEKKRAKVGEPISRFERYLESRWQVVIAHKRLRVDGSITGDTTKTFLEWFKPAMESGVIQQFSSSDPTITGLPQNSIGVRRSGSEAWEDWRAIAKEYPLERLAQLNAEQQDPELYTELRYYQQLYDQGDFDAVERWSRYQTGEVEIRDDRLVVATS